MIVYNILRLKLAIDSVLDYPFNRYIVLFQFYTKNLLFKHSFHSQY